MKGDIEILNTKNIRSLPESSTIFGRSILIVGLMASSIIYFSFVSRTGELNSKRQIEYHNLENKIFRGENPLADLDSDGKISPLEKGLAYNSMGVESYEDKPTLEQLRGYVNWKEFESNELQ